MYASHLDHYQLPVEEVVQTLQTNLRRGLNTEIVAERQETYGKNALKEGKRINPLKIFLRHLVNFMSLVLLSAMGLSLLVGEWIDAGIVGFIIICNSIIGFTQEYRSEKTMEALKKMSSPTSQVIREGHLIEVESSSLVPGDIVCLKEGDKVPADMRFESCLSKCADNVRIFKVSSLECDEAMLTGESDPIHKVAEPIQGEKGIGDMKNMAFMGTTVTKGKGKGIVVAIGQATEMGKISNMITGTESQETKLHKRMNRLGQALVVAAIGCIGLVLLAGQLHGTYKVYPKGLQIGISAAVSIIPEALVPVITLTLTIGVRKMTKQNALVRKLASLENLGNVTNICTDKTGTLTQGKMVATNVWVATNKEYKVTGEGIIPIGKLVDEEEREYSAKDVPKNSWLHMLLNACCICNTSNIVKRTDDNGIEEWSSSGSPTEVALTVLARKLGFEKNDPSKSAIFTWHQILEFPFDSTIKRMSVVYTNLEERKTYLFLKGAPESVLSLCTKIAHKDGSEKVLLEDYMAVVTLQNTRMAALGLRVLCVAFKTLPSRPNGDEQRSDMENSLTLLGFVGIKDPPRESVPHAVQVCAKAGIVVHMLTGDHPSTATAIAKQVPSCLLSLYKVAKVGIIPENEKKGMIMTADEFDNLTDEEAANLKELPLVIARCSPESKVKMVKLLHARGATVAMTGDGVNDAPAIKMADVGIAMGKNGSDVTREVSDIVLTDDNFSTIVVAIKEGRRIFANIRKFIVHLLAGNVAECMVLVLGVLIGLPPPLQPLQVLWLNLVTGTPVALALGVEPASKHLLNKKYRPTNEGLFTTEAMFDMMVLGTMMGVITMLSFFLSEGYEVKAQATAFATLTLLLLVHAYNCRVLERSMFMDGMLKDKWMHLAVLVGVVSLMCTFIPGVDGRIFHQTFLGKRGIVIVLIGVAIFVVLSEMYKLVKGVIRTCLRKRTSQSEFELVEVRTMPLAG